MTLHRIPDKVGADSFKIEHDPFTPALTILQGVAMNMPALPRALRVLIILIVSTMFTVAAADRNRRSSGRMWDAGEWGKRGGGGNKVCPGISGL
jgi:hypothetical protein